MHPSPLPNIPLPPSEPVVCQQQLPLVAGNELDISGKPPARQWIAAVYFAVMMVTTVGLGDIKACTPAEEVLASFQMLLGVFLFGLIVSTSQCVFLLLLLLLLLPPTLNRSVLLSGLDIVLCAMPPLSGVMPCPRRFLLAVSGCTAFGLWCLEHMSGLLD